MSETQGQSGYQYGFYYNMYCVCYIYITKVKPLMDTFEFTTVSLNGVFLVAVGILILFTVVELNLMYTCLFTL